LEKEDHVMRVAFLRGAVLFGGLALTACTQADGSTALGREGSPAWMATASPAAKLATYRGNCEGYGFVAGTPEMAQCVQQEAGSYRAGASSTMAAISDNMAAMSQRQPITVQPTTTTNCQPSYGGGMRCTSF
jgi:hypothetical protein